MTRGLADHHLLDELAHDVDEGLLRFRVGMLVHVIEGGVDDQLDCSRAHVGLQLADLLPEIFLFFSRGLPQIGFKAGAAFLEFVEHVVEGCKTRLALCLAILICSMVWRCSRSSSFRSRFICSRSAFGRRSLAVSSAMTLADMVSNTLIKKKATGKQSSTRPDG